MAFGADNYMGNTFFWWMGIVEENDDSKAEDGLKLGRCRVRILGLHSPTLDEDDVEGEGISVEQLHWAIPIQPITSAGMSGIGTTPLGIVKGSTVVGFSRDGGMSQDLIIMGVIGGYNEELKNPDFSGFVDPDGKFPLGTHEEDTNRLARNEETNEKPALGDGQVKETLHPILEVKEASVVSGVHKANDGSWSQPEIQYATKYPYNKVRESYHEDIDDYGHIEEWDDTKGEERLTLTHKAGTYRDIYSNGDRVVHIEGDSYHITVKDNNIYAKGNVSISADANVYVYAAVDVQVEAGNDINMVAGNDIKMTAGNSIMSKAGNYITETAGTFIAETASLFINNTAGLKIASRAGLYISEMAGIKISELTIAKNTNVVLGGYISELSNINKTLGLSTISELSASIVNTASIISINGNIVHVGNTTQAGVHTDSIGTHAA
jgi:hypothetical protein